MGLVPDLLTGDCPWCSDTHKPVSSGLSQ